MKICQHCHTEKTENEFSIQRRSRNSRQAWCKSCNAEYAHTWYINNRATHLITVKQAAKRSNERLAVIIINYLKIHPCVDCGESDIVVLDFDHVDRTQKKYNISILARNMVSPEKLMDEIRKCVVRCSNCHRRRTAKQFGWRKLRPVIEPTVHRFKFSN